MEKVSDYRYELPPELVASRPAERRDASRMLVLHRASGQIEHRMFRDFPTFLGEGDLVALNDSRVIKARLLATNPDIEVFLLESLGGTRWKCLVKPGRKMRQGVEVEIAGAGTPIRTAYLGKGELLKNKRASGRPKDLDDVEHLA